MIIEGFGSGSIPLTNRSGFGSRRPKKYGSRFGSGSATLEKNLYVFLSRRITSLWIDSSQPSKAGQSPSLRTLRGRKGGFLFIFMLSENLTRMRVNFGSYFNLQNICRWRQVKAGAVVRVYIWSSHFKLGNKTDYPIWCTHIYSNRVDRFARRWSPDFFRDARRFWAATCLFLPRFPQSGIEWRKTHGMRKVEKITILFVLGSGSISSSHWRTEQDPDLTFVVFL